MHRIIFNYCSDKLWYINVFFRYVLYIKYTASSPTHIIRDIPCRFHYGCCYELFYQLLDLQWHSWESYFSNRAVAVGEVRLVCFEKWQVWTMVSTNHPPTYTWVFDGILVLCIYVDPILFSKLGLDLDCGLTHYTFCVMQNVQYILTHISNVCFLFPLMTIHM